MTREKLFVAAGPWFLAGATAVIAADAFAR